MNRTLKIIAWTCGVVFSAFFIATIYKSGGHELPERVEYYRSLFQNGLEWFLSSWMFGVFFIVMWIGVSFHTSRASGWRRLSEKFSNRPIGFVEPPAFTLCSGKFGAVSQNGILKVGFSKSGIVFKVVFLFRLWHPPLYLPWASIKSIEIQRSRVSDDSAFRKIAEFLSPFKYASINLTEYPDQVALVGWKEAFIKSIPPEIMSKQGDF